jgi:hypothetical protein
VAEQVGTLAQNFQNLPPMRNTLSLFVCSFLANSLSAQTPANQPPVISNFVASADWPNNTLTLSYDVSDAENDPLEISLAFSGDGGKTYALSMLVTASGDTGFPVTAGAGKTITCDISQLAAISTNFTVRLVADDKQPFDIQQLVDEVDSLRLRDDLAFVEGIRHRTAGLTHLNAVRDSIRSHFSNLNLFLHEQTFTYLNATGLNIIGSQPGTGTAEKVVIVDAHYDTVNNSPGADDNGSGVVGFMEVSRLLSRYPAKKTVRYIGFDMEEDGLRGSLAYNNSGIPASEQIEGVLNFEMIGYYTEEPNTQEVPAGFGLVFPDAVAEITANEYRGDFITNVANSTCQPLALLFSNSAAEYVPDLKVITLIAPGNGTLFPDLLRSDHAPFWLNNRPALMLTDGANFRNECYHTPMDMADEKLSFTFMSNVVKATLAAAAQLAEVQHGDWATASFQGTSNATAPACQSGFGFSAGSTNVLFFSLHNCVYTSAQVEIFDEKGRLLLSETLALSENEQYEIALPSPLPAGVYFAKTIWPGGMRTDKFFINR